MLKTWNMCSTPLVVPLINYLLISCLSWGLNCRWNCKWIYVVLSRAWITSSEPLYQWFNVWPDGLWCAQITNVLDLCWNVKFLSSSESQWNDLKANIKHSNLLKIWFLPKFYIKNVENQLHSWQTIYITFICQFVANVLSSFESVILGKPKTNGHEKR